jgi:hypothetical protein
VELGNPPKNKSSKLATLEIDFETIMVSWLKERSFMK